MRGLFVLMILIGSLFTIAVEKPQVIVLTDIGEDPDKPAGAVPVVRMILMWKGLLPLQRCGCAEIVSNNRE